MHKRGVSNHQQVYSTSHTLRKVECWRRLPLVRSCGAKVNISSTFWFVRLATPQYYVQVQVTNFSYIVTMSFSYLVLGHLVISAPSSVNLKLRGCWWCCFWWCLTEQLDLPSLRKYSLLLLRPLFYFSSVSQQRAQSLCPKGKWEQWQFFVKLLQLHTSLPHYKQRNAVLLLNGSSQIAVDGSRNKWKKIELLEGTTKVAMQY